MAILNLIIPVIACALLMRLKGAGTRAIRLNIDSRYTSGVLFGAFSAWYLHSYWGLLAAPAWVLGNTPSIGEIFGGLGGAAGNWARAPDGNHIFTFFPRKDDLFTTSWKLGVQRGIFTGALLALALWKPAFIIPGAMFAPAYYLGVSIEQWRTKEIAASVWLAELLWGACLGTGFWEIRNAFIG